MIRRWSCLINLNNNFSKFPYFKKNYKISLFKSSVNFKKFTFKITKLKRKSLLRFKHRSNWLIYTNILKYWVKDYMFNKTYLRYQFLNKLFLNNFYFYNFNFIKNRNETFFYNFNFIFFTLTNKKTFYFSKKHSFIKNSPLFIALFVSQPVLNNSIVPVYSSWNENFYQHSSCTNIEENYKYSIVSMFDVFFNLFIQKITEIRKIITILYYFNINFKKLNKFVFKTL